MSKTEKCLLCGKPSNPKPEEEYLDGFCEACVYVMKNEKDKRSVSRTHIEINEKITFQIKNIESLLSNILDKPDKTSFSESSSYSTQKAKTSIGSKVTSTSTTSSKTIAETKNQSLYSKPKTETKNPSSPSRSKTSSKSKKKYKPSTTACDDQ